MNWLLFVLWLICTVALPSAAVLPDCPFTLFEDDNVATWPCDDSCSAKIRDRGRTAACRRGLEDHCQKHPDDCLKAGVISDVAPAITGAEQNGHDGQHLARRTVGVGNLYCATALLYRNPCSTPPVPPATCSPECCLQNLPSADPAKVNSSCFDQRSSFPSDAEFKLASLDPSLFTATPYESLILSDPGFESWTDPFPAISDESRLRDILASNSWVSVDGCGQLACIVKDPSIQSRTNQFVRFFDDQYNYAIEQSLPVISRNVSQLHLLFDISRVSTAGVGDMQAFTTVTISIVAKDGSPLATLASSTVLSNTILGSSSFTRYYYNAGPASPVLWSLYDVEGLRLRISYQASRTFSIQKLVTVTIDNVMLYATTAMPSKPLKPVRLDGSTLLDATTSFPRAPSEDGAFDNETLSQLSCDTFYEIPRTFKLPPYSPPQLSPYFGQWGPTNRFNTYLKTGNVTADGFASVYPDYTNLQMPIPGIISQVAGQIVDFSNLNPLSQLIQQSFIPSGNLLPGSDFLGVGYDPKGKYATWENAQATLFKRSFFQKRTFEGFTVPDNVDILGVWRTVAETNVYSSVKDFQKSLAARVEASGSGSFFGITASFSASASYKSDSSSSTKTMKGVREIRTELWEARLKRLSWENTHGAFKCMVEKLRNVSLCTDEGLDQYFSLFKIFGSHYVSSLVMGGNLWVETEEQMSDQSSSEEISASMELSLSYMTASGKIKASYDSKQKQQIQSTSSRIRFVANGGDPMAARMVTEIGDRGSDSPDFTKYFELWLNTVIPKPQIAKFGLRPIHDLVPASLGDVKRNLKFAYALYSSNVVAAGSDFELPASVDSPVWFYTRELPRSPSGSEQSATIITFYGRSSGTIGLALCVSPTSVETTFKISIGIDGLLITYGKFTGEPLVDTTAGKFRSDGPLLASYTFVLWNEYLYFFKTSIKSVSEIEFRLEDFLKNALVVRQEDLANVKFYGFYSSTDPVSVARVTSQRLKSTSFFLKRLLSAASQDSLILQRAGGGLDSYDSPKLSSTGLTRALLTVDLDVAEFQKITENPDGPILALKLASDGTGTASSAYSFELSSGQASLVVRGTLAGRLTITRLNEASIVDTCGSVSDWDKFTGCVRGNVFYEYSRVNGTKTLWISMDGSFVTIGTGDVSEENTIISFRDYKQMLVQNSIVANLKNSNDFISLSAIGGSGVQTSDVATLPFDPSKIGTSIYYAFDCDSILAVNASFAATPRLVVAAQRLDVSASSVDAFPVDCAKSTRKVLKYGDAVTLGFSDLFLSSHKIDNATEKILLSQAAVCPKCKSLQECPLILTVQECANRLIPFVFRLINPEKSSFYDSSTILFSQSRFILTPYYYTKSLIDKDMTDGKQMTFSLVDASFLSYLTKSVVPNVQLLGKQALRTGVDVLIAPRAPQITLPYKWGTALKIFLARYENIPRFVYLLPPSYQIDQRGEAGDEIYAILGPVVTSLTRVTGPIGPVQSAIVPLKTSDLLWKVSLTSTSDSASALAQLIPPVNGSDCPGDSVITDSGGVKQCKTCPGNSKANNAKDDCIECDMDTTYTISFIINRIGYQREKYEPAGYDFIVLIRVYVDGDRPYQTFNGKCEGVVFPKFTNVADQFIRWSGSLDSCACEVIMGKNMLYDQGFYNIINPFEIRFSASLMPGFQSKIQESDIIVDVRVYDIVTEGGITGVRNACRDVDVDSLRIVHAGRITLADLKEQVNKTGIAFVLRKDDLPVIQKIFLSGLTLLDGYESTKESEVNGYMALREIQVGSKPEIRRFSTNTKCDTFAAAAEAKAATGATV